MKYVDNLTAVYPFKLSTDWQSVNEVLSAAIHFYQEREHILRRDE